MNLQNIKPAFLSLLLITIALSFSCKKDTTLSLQPELEPLQQGLKTSAAIAYCASIAHSSFKGKELPSNVTYVKNSGLIYIKIDKNNPLPFNSSIGEIVIAGIWGNTGGVISILFSKIDILGGNVKLFGLYTIPVIESTDKKGIITLFAKEDIIIGSGSDTILNISNMSGATFNTEIKRGDAKKANDAFVAVKQNFWFVDINQAKTDNNAYDDTISVNGGGQIAEISGSSGGVLYHALIKTTYNYSNCSKNPTMGNALSQNFKAGDGLLSVDLGSTFMSFHSNCDGMVHVDVSTGKYVGYSGKDVSLGLP